MEYAKFRKLVKEGEKDRVDFKIRCDAFNSALKQPNAEFAKDICAMSNNGYRASYIIVGVSDDGENFLSVSNPKLTEQNVQSFCKTAISPPPYVRIHTECWPKAGGEHKGKRFVIIQVGPNARQAFRLAKDFIAYDEQVCYRRNEVWIRRGSTSDLAAPEEIVRLAEGRPPIEKTKLQANTEYLKLSKDDQIPSVLEDISAWAEEMGGCLTEGRVVVPIDGVRHVWRCDVSRERNAQRPVWVDMRKWGYEHGFLFVVLGTVSKKALPAYQSVQFKQPWGWFTLLADNWPDNLPRNKDTISLVVLALPHIADTEALRGSLSRLVDFLSTDEKASDYVRQARDSVNQHLRRWRGEGWEETDKTMFPRVTTRKKPAHLMKLAGTILDLSAGRLP